MECFVKGLKVSYTIIGEGRPFLILHGWGSKKENWQKVAENLDAKVIVLDLPGFGQSQEPSFAWAVNDYCDFVKEFAEKLGLKKFSLLGHSFGGAIALIYGSKYPEKLEKLFLVAAACFRKTTLKKKLFYIISKTIPRPGRGMRIRKIFYRKSDYLATKGIMREIYLKLIKTDLSHFLEKIKVPTIIIWGRKDNITPLGQGKLIKEKIKDSEIKIIPKAGHDLNLKFPKELSKIINGNF